MNLYNRIFKPFVQLTEEQAATLKSGSPDLYPVKVHPPENGVPNQITRTVRGILEFQSKWFGIRNASPRAAFEIHRGVPGKINLQFLLPTKRLERKLRTQLKSEIPGVKFSKGTSQIPVTENEFVGGGQLTTGRRDWYPLRTDGFNAPPQNSVVSLLHRHAMRDTKIVIQLLFQPVTGKPVRNWWWRHRAYQRLGYLRKEKEKLWNSRPPTPRERRQADNIEDKAGVPRFYVSIRFLIIGAEEYTPSRVKELAGGYNIYENLDSGQYLDAVTIRGIRKAPILHHAKTVAKRQFNGSHRFQVSIPELAALVSLPEPNQENIQTAKP